MKYDYLIVGAGISGATFAQQAKEAGKTCLVIDRRDHIAGNMYTEKRNGIDIHIYGPHLFHTNNKPIWDYVQRFAEFNDYHHTVVAQTATNIVSLPINLHTLNQLFGIQTPQQAADYFERVREDVIGNNIESWCLRNIGRELYTLLLRDYTIKQWNTLPALLPDSIIKRLPVYHTYNTHYFTDRYQGIPVEGYTALVERMLEGIPIVLGIDYLKDRHLAADANKVVYTGALDEYYNYMYGKLPYRSIRMEHEYLPDVYAQGSGQVNYTSLREPYTRITEPKHFTGQKTAGTIVSYEYSVDDGEPYYPINTAENNTIAAMYITQAISEGLLPLGRMAMYRYYDMHQAIAHALMISKKELHGYN